MKHVYRFILDEDYDEKVLEDDEVLEEILTELDNINKKLITLTIKLDNILDFSEMKF